MWEEDAEAGRSFESCGSKTGSVPGRSNPSCSKKLPSFRKLQQQFIWWMARYGKIWLLSDFRVLISSLLPSSEGLVDCGLRGGMAQAYRRLNDEHAKDRPPFSLATSCVEKMTGFLGTVQYLKLDRHFFRLCTSSWCSCDPSPANGN